MSSEGIRKWVRPSQNTSTLSDTLDVFSSGDLRQPIVHGLLEVLQTLLRSASTEEIQVTTPPKLRAFVRSTVSRKSARILHPRAWADGRAVLRWMGEEVNLADAVEAAAESQLSLEAAVNDILQCKPR